MSDSPSPVKHIPTITERVNRLLADQSWQQDISFAERRASVEYAIQAFIGAHAAELDLDEAYTFVLRSLKGSREKQS